MKAYVLCGRHTEAVQAAEGEGELCEKELRLPLREATLPTVAQVKVQLAPADEVDDEVELRRCLDGVLVRALPPPPHDTTVSD